MDLYLKWTPSPRIAAARKGENEHIWSTYKVAVIILGLSTSDLI